MKRRKQAWQKDTGDQLIPDPERQMFLVVQEVCAVFRFSKAQLMRLVGAGQFPRPIRFGSPRGHLRWWTKDILAFIAAKQAELKQSTIPPDEGAVP